MSTLALHAKPATRTVVEEQIRAVGLALRKEGKLFLIFLILLGVLIIGSALSVHNTPLSASASGSGFTVSRGFTLSLEGGNVVSDNAGIVAMLLFPVGLVGLLFPFGLAGGLAPFGVWRSEEPSRRSYHWAMPVAHGSHTLIKTLAGWFWLMLAVVTYSVFVCGFLAIDKYILGISYSGPSVNMVPAWGLIIPLIATTIVYLCTSIAVIGSEHPWRWIGGVITLYMIALSCFAASGQHQMMEGLKSIVIGPYGLLMALIGPLLHGDNVMAWLPAIILWTVASVLGVGIAAYWRRDATRSQ